MKKTLLLRTFSCRFITFALVFALCFGLLPLSALAAAGDTAFIDEQPSEVYYEIFVRAFADSDGDGVGDFKGLESRLTYLKDLGVSGIWLMPIQDNGSYHGYDTTDYYNVEPDYGTMEDFEHMLQTANSLGINVIMDLVVNHSSNNVMWFKEALKGPENPFFNWYTFTLRSNTDVRVDNSTGSPTGSPWRNTTINGTQYKYIGIFSSGMPDLNFDNTAVRSEMIKIGQFWLNKGVGGFRLDAAKHIFGDFAGTVHSPEIVKKNMDWWKEFRAGMQAVKPDVYLVGEIWEEDTSLMAPFIQTGTLNSTFDFKQAVDLLAMSKNEQASPNFNAALCRLYDDFGAVSGYDFVNCTFLTNHDQNRVMSQLEKNADHAKTAAAMMLTLPGNPFIYYGEELGLQGMKPDQDIREPMPWYESNEGPGQTNWKPKSNASWKNVYSLGGDVSVEAQAKDPSSILSRYKELTGWRRDLRVLRDGDVAEYVIDNSKVCAYVRMTRDDRVLVATNLSGEPQKVTLSQTQAFSGFNSIKKRFALDTTSALDGNALTIAPYSTVVLSGDTAVPAIYVSVTTKSSILSNRAANIVVNAFPVGFAPASPINVSLIAPDGKVVGTGIAGSDGAAFVRCVKVPEAGDYRFVASSGGITGECPLKVVDPAADLWSRSIAPSGTNPATGGTYLKFGAVPRSRQNCLNFDGHISINGEVITTGTFVYKADNAGFNDLCRIYIPRPYNTFKEGDVIVVSGLVFKDLFPSYNLTYTITL